MVWLFMLLSPLRLWVWFSAGSRAGLRNEGVTQLGHGLVFYLSDALSGDSVDVADFSERAWLAVDEPESQPDYAGLAFG